MHPRPRHKVIQIPRIHEMRRRILDPCNAAIAHRDPQLILQNIDQVLHAFLPVSRRVQETPSDAHPRRAETQAFEDI